MFPEDSHFPGLCECVTAQSNWCRTQKADWLVGWLGFAVPAEEDEHPERNSTCRRGPGDQPQAPRAHGESRGRVTWDTRFTRVTSGSDVGGGSCWWVKQGHGVRWACRVVSGAWISDVTLCVT